MKTSLLLKTFLFASLLIGGASARAETTATPDPKRELRIVVVESTQKPRGAITDFDRLDIAFQKVAGQRKWPMKVVSERFASNSPVHPIELKVFNQRLREETSGDLTFHGWMTLTVDGTKHDFGVLKYQYYRRGGEQMDDSLDKVFLGAAKLAAEKIEPILFPELAGSKS